MNSRKYWEQRRVDIVKAEYEKAEATNKELRRHYKRASKEIVAEVERFYIKFSKDNGLSYEDAVKSLTKSEYKQFRMSVEDYAKKHNLKFELNTLSGLSKLTRLASLFFQIDNIVSANLIDEGEIIKNTLSTAIESTFYKNMFEFMKFGLISEQQRVKINSKTVKSILEYPWSGKHFSDRIWRNRGYLVDNIKEEITQKLIQGTDVRKVSRNIAKKMNSGYKNAERLVRTETAHVIEEASAKSYEETDTDEYIILATLDMKTSKICRKLDGKVYKLKDRKVGLNYPPLHPNCRTTTGPNVELSEDDVRIARDKNGKNIFIPANMTYAQWKKKYID